MKNSDLDYYHKFSIVEYSLNIKKFREYLDYLKKNDIEDEKMVILGNLISHLNEASINNSKDKDNVIEKIQTMCVLVIKYYLFNHIFIYLLNRRQSFILILKSKTFSKCLVLTYIFKKELCIRQLITVWQKLVE